MAGCRSTRGPLPMMWSIRRKDEHDSNGAAQESKSHRTGGRELQGCEDNALRGMRPQCHFRAYYRMLLRAGGTALERGEVLRHRLFLKIACVFPRIVARVQRSTWPDAVGCHRRHAGEPNPSRDRCYW